MDLADELEEWPLESVGCELHGEPCKASKSNGRDRASRPWRPSFGNSPCRKCKHTDVDNVNHGKHDPESETHPHTEQHRRREVKREHERFERRVETHPQRGNPVDGLHEEHERTAVRGRHRAAGKGFTYLTQHAEPSGASSALRVFAPLRLCVNFFIFRRGSRKGAKAQRPDS